MQIKEALFETRKALMKFGIYNPAMEARLLLCYATTQTEEYLIAHKDAELSTAQSALLQDATARRQRLEPIAYIVGHKEFFSREFIVNPHVLIPRPDSEILIESVLSDYKDTANLTILDLGAGSGCLVITLLLELQAATAVAVEIDANALKVTKANAAKHNVSGLKYVLGDWFTKLKLSKKFDIIIANPPYISSDKNVARETLLYEPHIALFAQNKGLDAYSIIASTAKNFLNPNGMLYLEIGYDQEKTVIEIFTKQGYKLQRKTKDLAGHVRCLKFQ